MADTDSGSETKKGIKIHVPSAKKDPAHPCKGNPCGRGQVCVEQQVQCFAAPCYPVRVCVSLGKNTQASAI
ncbi:hypothetical protein IW150_002367 [Coemansia sp. RSA 2607]|nr:hypothetical protein IW150_002367 [Coemansia sp. RSA 2607]